MSDDYQDSPEFREAVAKAVAEEMARQKAAKPVEQTATPGPARPGELVRFDARSGQRMDETVVAELWTGRVVERGDIKYGQTQRVRGQIAIRKALRPTLNANGEVERPGWMPADQETAQRLGRKEWMPEELLLTPEKKKALSELGNKPLDAAAEAWAQDRFAS